MRSGAPEAGKVLRIKYLRISTGQKSKRGKEHDQDHQCGRLTEACSRWPGVMLISGVRHGLEGVAYPVDWSLPRSQSTTVDTP